MNTLRIGHLPGLNEADLCWQDLPGLQLPSGHCLQVPTLSPAQLQALCAQLRGPGRAALRALPVREIVQAIDASVQQLLDVRSEEHQCLLHWLPLVTGFSAEMVRINLNATLRTYRAPQLQRFIAEDFGSADMLDAFVPRPTGGLTHAEGAALITHVWAGNVPGLALWSLVSGLLVKAGNLGKVSQGEPVLASVFARTLARIAPVLGSAMAVLWWERQEQALAQSAWAASDVVLAFGGDAALADLQRQMPAGVRFLPHGHKISFGAVGREALSASRAPRSARLAAEDLLRHEQQGCYSPQCFYVERGGQVSPQEFAERLAAELQQLATRFPRPQPGLAEATQIAQWRSRFEWDAQVTLIGQPEDGWCVASHAEPVALAPGPLHRCVQVVAIDALDALAPWLQERQPQLQTVGLAVAPERLQPLALRLAACGVTRICALGQMPLPAPGWHNDGRPSLLDLVNLVDLEASAETLAEGLAGYEI
ncbi:MAG: acyl-CoA reductase [Betaproteobacteria bacterium]|nr:acyl-CoA reductase [Betaproteobacteria bacterium]